MYVTLTKSYYDSKASNYIVIIKLLFYCLFYKVKFQSDQFSN